MAAEIGEPDTDIVWDGEVKRFQTPDGSAYLQCALRSSQKDGAVQQVIEMQQIFVPRGYGVQGIREKLCVSAFQHAKREKLLVLPTCSYVSATFIPNNPEWNDVVVKDATANESEILFDGERRRFRTPDGSAYLTYSLWTKKNGGEPQPVMDIQHTFVPSKFRGQGIARKLCEAAFKHARTEKLLVQPSCSYVSETFLPKSPEWNDLVVKDTWR